MGLLPFSKKWNKNQDKYFTWFLSNSVCFINKVVKKLYQIIKYSYFLFYKVFNIFFKSKPIVKKFKYV